MQRTLGLLPTVLLIYITFRVRFGQDPCETPAGPKRWDEAFVRTVQAEEHARWVGRLAVAVPASWECLDVNASDALWWCLLGSDVAGLETTKERPDEEDGQHEEEDQE